MAGREQDVRGGDVDRTWSRRRGEDAGETQQERHWMSPCWNPDWTWMKCGRIYDVDGQDMHARSTRRGEDVDGTGTAAAARAS